MAKFNLKLDTAGVRDLLRSDAMLEQCKEVAKDIEDACGNGYGITTRKGRNRVNAMVLASSDSAKKAGLTITVERTVNSNSCKLCASIDNGSGEQRRLHRGCRCEVEVRVR